MPAKLLPRHAKRTQVTQIATKSTCQATPKTCKDSASYANSDKNSLPSYSQDMQRKRKLRKWRQKKRHTPHPTQAKRAQVTQIATKSACQATPKTCKESASYANSDKMAPRTYGPLLAFNEKTHICLPSFYFHKYFAMFVCTFPHCFFVFL